MLVYLGWQYNISFSQIMSWFDHYQPHLVYSTIEYHPIINIIWCRRVCTLKIPNLYHFGYVNHFDVCFPHKWKKKLVNFLVYSYLLKHQKNVFKQILMDDETWMLYNNVEHYRWNVTNHSKRWCYLYNGIGRELSKFF